MGKSENNHAAWKPAKNTELIKNYLESIGQIRIKNIDYYRHPIYDLYAADLEGNVININRKVPMKGNNNYRGYLKIMVRGSDKKNWKNYYVHRFVYECIFGLIPEGLVIDHINSNKEDNSLINLKLITQQENSKKGAKNQDYSKAVKKIAKPVKAINIETKQTFYFNSMRSAEKNLSIDNSIIGRCCRKEYGYKTGISKEDGQRYKFEFTTKLKITEC